MNKEELEKQISLLQERVEANKVMNQGYERDLLKAKQDLEDLNKPELTPRQLDDIHNAVENAVNDFDFEDTDNYNIEYELDYDGRVNANSLEFQQTYELVEKIVDKLCKLFKEAECPETDECESIVTKAN